MKIPVRASLASIILAASCGGGGGDPGCGSTCPPPADTTPPSVQVSSTGGIGKGSFSMTAADNESAVSSTELYLNDTRVRSGTGALSVADTTLAPGTYTVRGAATSRGGTGQNSSQFTVTAPIPTVSITNASVLPASVLEGDSARVTGTATASDLGAVTVNAVYNNQTVATGTGTATGTIQATNPAAPTINASRNGGSATQTAAWTYTPLSVTATPASNTATVGQSINVPYSAPVGTDSAGVIASDGRRFIGANNTGTVSVPITAAGALTLTPIAYNGKPVVSKQGTASTVTGTVASVSITNASVLPATVLEGDSARVTGTATASDLGAVAVNLLYKNQTVASGTGTATGMIQATDAAAPIVNATRNGSSATQTAAWTYTPLSITATPSRNTATIGQSIDVAYNAPLGTDSAGVIASDGRRFIRANNTGTVSVPITTAGALTLTPIAYNGKPVVSRQGTASTVTGTVAPSAPTAQNFSANINEADSLVVDLTGRTTGLTGRAFTAPVSALYDVTIRGNNLILKAKAQGATAWDDVAVNGNATYSVTDANGTASGSIAVGMLAQPDLFVTPAETADSARVLNATMNVRLNGVTYAVPVAGRKIQARTGANTLELAANGGFYSLNDWQIPGARTPLNANMTSAAVTLEATDRTVPVKFLHANVHPEYRSDANVLLNSKLHIDQAYTGNNPNGGFSGMTPGIKIIYTPLSSVTLGGNQLCAATPQARADAYKAAVISANNDNVSNGLPSQLEHVTVATLPASVATLNPSTGFIEIAPNVGVVCDRSTGSPTNVLYLDASGHFMAFIGRVPSANPTVQIQVETNNLADLAGEALSASNYTRQALNGGLILKPGDIFVKQYIRPLADELAKQGKPALKLQ